MSFREELMKIVDNNDVSSLRLLLHKNPIVSAEIAKPYLDVMQILVVDRERLSSKRELYDTLLEQIHQWNCEEGRFIYSILTMGYGVVVSTPPVIIP
jgi:hypothetical protein